MGNLCSSNKGAKVHPVLKRYYNVPTQLEVYNEARRRVRLQRDALIHAGLV